ncbi:MAG: hypothetical protein K2K53_10920, partial [Oscillospiraceae bacterium]|nr:hypothetical protein [Oscillospiraceae bacterium]
RCGMRLCAYHADQLLQGRPGCVENTGRKQHFSEFRGFSVALEPSITNQLYFAKEEMTYRNTSCDHLAPFFMDFGAGHGSCH